MEKAQLNLLIQLHQNNERQGPGSAQETKRALSFLDINQNNEVKIADIGCGTGAQTITLAQNTSAHITAVDISPEFLAKLNQKAKKINLQDRIKTSPSSMEDLPFDNESYDIIWSEGAIYIMGFEKGLQDWKKYIKPKGYLVCSDICWFTNSRPQKLQQYWEKEGVKMQTATEKLTLLEQNGYSVVAYFQLPQYCWIDEYYKPLEESYPDFLKSHNYSELAENLIQTESEEIAIYHKYKNYYGYGFFIAQKR